MKAEPEKEGKICRRTFWVRLGVEFFLGLDKVRLGELVISMKTPEDLLLGLPRYLSSPWHRGSPRRSLPLA